jgi:hypothetical protein
MKIVMPVQRAEARVSAVSPEAERLAIPYAAMGTRNGEKREQKSACCVVTSVRHERYRQIWEPELQ